MSRSRCSGDTSDRQANRTIGECARHDGVQARRRSREDGPDSVAKEAKCSIQAVDRPTTDRGHGLRQPCLLHRTEWASPSVAASAKPSHQCSSTKKPGLRGDQCNRTGNCLSRLVGKEKSLSTATVAEWSREQRQYNATHQRGTQQGTDRHRRPAERTQIQRKVYCKCTLSDATNRVAKSSRVARVPSFVIARSWAKAPGPQS